MAGTLTVSPKASPFPFSAIAAAAYTQKVELNYDPSATGLTLDLDGSTITSEEEAVKALAKAGGLSEDSAKTPAYFALAKSLIAAAGKPEITSALDSLDDHLAWRTFLIGHEITAADWIVWGALKGNLKIVGFLKNNLHQHLLRWYNFLESLESAQAAIAGLAEAKATKARAGRKDCVLVRVGSSRGYLHIGHTKAAILNQYFAKMYNGKLLIRFDDTNPSKERTEFEDTILEDLALLNIKGDKISHTSDYFDYLYDLAVKIIESGNAYADDTEQAQMREERMNGIASKNRDATVEQNLARFAEMKKGTMEGLRWCIRAKMSVDNPNKAMRDPVIYRCNVLPHHRTGDKWKIYPTYDFACPVVDSLEGVTHALRTNEYRDRNPQYQWMISALGLRPVAIWDFSRLNFIYTLLSKRKLRWFVDTGRVRVCLHSLVETGRKHARSSSGSASFTGFAEAEDLQEVVQVAIQESGDVEEVLILGYSHGSLVASLHPVLPPPIRTMHVLLSYPLGPRGFLTLFNARTYEDRLEALLRDSRAHVLVVHGDADNFTGAASYDQWADGLKAVVKQSLQETDAVVEHDGYCSSESATRSEQVLEACIKKARSASQLRISYQAFNGKQPGDPVKGMKPVVDFVHEEGVAEGRKVPDIA
ncbi:hypothetical protein EWM64_g6671 [Hericium alpestre]|uniref:Glutamyl/glutaminyl-tRNA synthetase class Ib catalytic domain-containing protein n=1 Tax=Hericium alpestre TaxID=135208 RepID=A0A4Y9ZRD7_9AGAM|nr:hypothetical protein EWM64_g6671 [Hericium alpestre]